MAYVSAWLGGDVLHMIPDRMIILLVRMDNVIMVYGINVYYSGILVEQEHPENGLAGLSVIEHGRKVEAVCTVQPMLLNVAFYQYQKSKTMHP